MRIIAGKHRSRKINYPKSDTIKPTADNVREAVFNLLPAVENFIVLDLFAGSGSYGLEALSRGAKFVYFNDIDRKSFQIIKENVANLKESLNAIITNYDFERALNNYQRNHTTFDLVFIDPPYFSNYYDKVIPLVIPLIKKGGKLVIEVDHKLDLSLTLSNLNIEKDRTYGSKRIVIVNVN